MDTVIDEGMVLGRVLSDEDFDGFLGGNTAQKGADGVEAGVAESQEFFQVFVFKGEI